MCFETSRVVFWSLLCYKELKLYTLRTLHGLPKVWAYAESKIFAFFPPLFFCFSWLILFSLAGHLVSFFLVGKGFRKAFRILGLDERKGSWVVEQDFHGNFRVNVGRFFAFFSGVLGWIVLILAWVERSIYSAHASGQSCPWPLKLKTSQVRKRMWIRMGGSGANGFMTLKTVILF